MIKLESVSKKFIISHEKQALVRNLLPTFLRINRYQELWALRNITLELPSSLSLGVMGRNGSGKTTLLNIIAGITVPEKGNVMTKGRIAAILTLGAGFHVELTGEENIFLNGTILGMTMGEIRNKFESIVDFSQLHDFIDAPLRTYSAGMQMRLGFSIAMHTDFDILLIDEVISVGDIVFQKKCMESINKFRREGKNIILATQYLSLIQALCDEAIVLEAGEIAYRGSVDDSIREYHRIVDMKAP